ncbi:exodeoxyribonuclease V subunit gamma [Buchnera aphidicola]|uniref:exodeoxyribonuclease V subunit gamma n=1 Tax=Buchnera aphidicola TaxID=9 RepID=UPI0021C26E70|nr:exodeoxyribonuclease V subunit gamma [Buchnera aphidicola]
MFFVYKSNQINILFTEVYKIIKEKPLLNIFDREIIINDNEVLFQYLNTFIANNTGISAYFKLIHPNVFIWKLFKKNLPNIKLNNIFSESIITWKIMKIIEKNCFIEFIQKKDKITKKFDFAFLMARLYEKYILYRPNWINKWEENQKKILKIDTNDEWQGKLWIKIINYTEKLKQSKCHFPNLLKRFILLIKQEKIKLPKRIFIISSLNLNPTYMEIFKKISAHTDVYFLSINASEKKFFHTSFIGIKKNYVLQENNSLINLWEKYEKFYFLFFKRFKKIKFNNFFQKNNKKNLLNIIKNDFLSLKKVESIIKKRSFLPQDNSISINICYNKKHEIEVLHKKILTLFNHNPKLKASDIVVTSFSLDTYISYINSIFKSDNKKEKIPFYISKKHSNTTEKILFVFNKILNLSNIRFSNEEILDLIEIQDIRDKFHIAEEEINVLYEWIEKSNIRWGLHQKQKKHLIFPKNNQNTWFYGIKKLLMSYAINEEEKICNNTLSFTSINTSRTELIGKLINFIETLDKWRNKLSFSKKIKSWRTLFICFINDFFHKNKKIGNSINIINKNWTKMIDDALLSNYQKKIPISILKRKFLYSMNYFSRKKFLPGVINFCHPSLTSYIPFKIKCIIGADNQEIPKKKI